MTDTSATPDTMTSRSVRHKKRGTTYTVIGEAGLQTNRPLVDGDRLVIYQGTARDLWARPPHEFEDGRFEDVPAPGYTVTPTVRDDPAPTEADRDAFERWYVGNDKGAQPYVQKLRRGDTYVGSSVHINGAWEAWQAMHARRAAELAAAERRFADRIIEKIRARVETIWNGQAGSLRSPAKVGYVQASIGIEELVIALLDTPRDTQPQEGADGA